MGSRGCGAVVLGYVIKFNKPLTRMVRGEKIAKSVEGINGNWSTSVQQVLQAHKGVCNEVHPRTV